MVNLFWFTMLSKKILPIAFLPLTLLVLLSLVFWLFAYLHCLSKQKAQFSKTWFLKIAWPRSNFCHALDFYRVIHVSLTFLIWLKRTLKRIEDMKERHFDSPEDPPFDMKHQLMSADSLPVVKIDLSRKVNFHYFFFHFYTI